MGGTPTLTNTIIARNSALLNPDVEGGGVTSEGDDLIGNTGGSSGWTTSDLLNRDPLLGPLQNNGGATDTYGLLPGNAANNAACPFIDQRGTTRKDGDKNGTIICDIGAFERNDLTP